uniref:PHD-type domain-containing protein n=1 Tax=Setaria digitata TaxID=48799 RepID=A0A915PEQ8_9BILA
MSVTDTVDTDRHVSEVLPSTEDSNSSTKISEDQPQEEGSDDKQQSQSWVAPNKPTLLCQGITAEAPRSLEPAEDFALHYLTRSVVKIMDNIGFSTCHESVLNILTDLCRRYMQKLWVDSKVFAEHAGRRYPIFEDANMVFGKLMFSVAELHGFMKQVQHDPLENNVPLFPVKGSSPNLLSIYGPVSDKELAERPEHIPRYFPAMHPEWCSDQVGVRGVEFSTIKGAAQVLAKSNRYMPRARMTKSKISFPDFSGSTAKELGFVRPQKSPPKKMAEEPSGISSSANVAALQITSTAASSASRTKPKKWSLTEPASSSKHPDEHHLKTENLKEKDALDKSFVQRSIGMFGMPPSALVHPESVSEKMKKKKKRERERDKDRSKEKKVRHRDKEKPKDKKEENASISDTVLLSAESLIYEKASTSTSCSTVFKNAGQGMYSSLKKPVIQQQVALPASHKQPIPLEQRQEERSIVDLKSDASEKPSTDVHFSHNPSVVSGEGVAVYGKEKDADKLKHGQTVDLWVKDGNSDRGVGAQVNETLKSQNSTNRTGEQLQEDHMNDISKIMEKTKEGVKDKDGVQKNSKGDVSKNMVVGSVKGKLEKRKVVEKCSEWKKVVKKPAENSLSAVVDGTTKSSNDSTPASQDLKTLKVVLSRSTGQKMFTAFSPSSNTDRTIKDVEQKYEPGNVFGGTNASQCTADESQTAESSEKKKKHRKEKDRDKHESKDHKRKDKRKYKEHKKDKTKDKEKNHTKLRPEKLCLKRPGEHFLSDEVPAPKIPKLKIRFGSNSSGVGTSPTGVVSANSPTVPAPTLSSVQPSERDVSSSVDQNIDVVQPTIKLDDIVSSDPYAPLKSDGNSRPRKRQPVTKAELKALPKLPLKTRTYGAKDQVAIFALFTYFKSIVYEENEMQEVENGDGTPDWGSGFTGGQGPANVTANPVVSKADSGFEQRNYMQQSTGKRLRMDDGKKDFLGSCFDACGAVTFSSAEKVLKSMGKEKSGEGGVQSMTLKCDTKSWGQLAPVEALGTFLTSERRQEKELCAKDLEEVVKKKLDHGQVAAEEMDLVKPKLGKEKDLLRRVYDGDLFDKEKPLVKDRYSGKLRSKEPEKEKKKDRQFHSLEKVRENGREKGGHHMQKADKERDQTKRDEKSLEIVDEKKGMQQERQKEKVVNGGEKKRGSDEIDKGKGRKIGMIAGGLGDGSGGSAGENEKKHREKPGKVVGSGEQFKRKGLDKDEEYGKGGEKDAKKNAKEKGYSGETKEKGRHHGKRNVVEEKVKGQDKDLREKEKKKKYLGGRGREHGTGRSSKDIEKVSSGEDEGFGGLDHVKTKNSNKDEATGDSDEPHPSHDPLLKVEQATTAKEQLSKRCSADSDIFGTRSSTADSLAKSSDKKSATLDSDDSLDTMWICPECSVAYVEGATDMVGCDACDNWFHWSCVGLLVAPPDDVPWYCQNCAKKKLKKKSSLKSSTSKKGKK